MTVLLLTSVLLAAALLPGAADPLQPFQWKNRIFLIFAAEPGLPVLEQTDIFADDLAGKEERAILVLSVVGATVSDSGRSDPLPDAGSLRQRFGIDADTAFAAVLVGLDGLEKMRWDAPVGRAELFRLIDAMPMRQAEDPRP